MLDYAEYRAISVYQKYLKNVSNNSNNNDNNIDDSNKYERSLLVSVEDMSNINIDYEVRILMRRLLTGPKKGYTLHNIQDILQGSLDGEYIWNLLHEHEQCQLEGRVFDGYEVSKRLLAGRPAELVTAPLEDIVKTVISTTTSIVGGTTSIATPTPPKISGNANNSARPNYQQRQQRQQQKGKGNAVSTNKPTHVKRPPKTLNNNNNSLTNIPAASSSTTTTIQSVRSHLGQSPSPSSSSLSITPDAALVIHISHDTVNLQQSDASVFYLLKNNLLYIGFQFDYSKQTWSYTTSAATNINTTTTTNTLVNNTSNSTTTTTTETKGGRKKVPVGKVKPVSEVVEIVKGLCSAYKIPYRLEQGV